MALASTMFDNRIWFPQESWRHRDGMYALNVQPSRRRSTDAWCDGLRRV